MAQHELLSVSSDSRETGMSTVSSPLPFRGGVGGEASEKREASVRFFKRNKENTDAPREPESPSSEESPGLPDPVAWGNGARLSVPPESNLALRSPDVIAASAGETYYTQPVPVPSLPPMPGMDFSLALPPASLRVERDDGSEELPVDVSPFTIGRKVENRLHLPNERVSRFHAELRFQDNGWLLFDVGSSNGVFVNGRRVSGSPLADGDMIDIGPYRLLFRDLRPRAAAPASEAAAFDILERIGRGGMANVYKARMAASGQIVAVKMPNLEIVDNPQETILRFNRESDITERLQHPHIVRVFGRGNADDGTPYMLMEYLEGGALRACMEPNAPLPERTLRAYGAGVAAGLDYAHRRGIVHRDIKPENMLFDLGGTIKVTDFGIARGKGSATLTQEGALIGTAHYMSPEQIEGATLTPASDLYALGCVLYEMATGRCPFEGAAYTVLNAHMTRKPEPPQTLNPTLTTYTSDLISALLEKQPDHRLASAEAVRQSLQVE